MKENIISEIFESKEQLNEKLLWWQEKLCLNNWTIVATLISYEEAEEDSEGCATVGCSEISHISRHAIIKILDGKTLPISAERFCAEEVLVHELLHCKYNILSCDDTYEGKMLDVFQHANLEEMAKTLIMVKYNLPFSYWKAQFWKDEW